MTKNATIASKALNIIPVKPPKFKFKLAANTV
ncbi:Uncharacterised protein [Staphylococcus aureus]|nr:Uncharacterised protein [Staphylococcus aureus]